MKYQCTKCDVIRKSYGDFVKVTCSSIEGHEVLPIADEKDIQEVNEGKIKQEKKLETKKVKGRIGSYFVESIILDDKPYFLCNIDDKLELKKSIEYGDKTYKPSVKLWVIIN